MPTPFGCNPSGAYTDYKYCCLLLVDYDPYYTTAPSTYDPFEQAGLVRTYNAATIAAGEYYLCDISELENASFLSGNDFDAFCIACADGLFGGPALTTDAITNIKNFVTGNICLLFSDIGDVVATDSPSGTIFSNGLQWVANKGYFGALWGAGYALQSYTELGGDTLQLVTGDATVTDYSGAGAGADSTVYFFGDYHPVTADGYPNSVELDSNGMEFWVKSSGTTSSWIIGKSNNSAAWDSSAWPLIVANPYGFDANGDPISCFYAEVSLNAYLKASKFVTLDAVLQGGSTFDMYYINKDPQNSSFSAMYITDVQDLDSNHWKHVKRVSIVGDYGDNEVELQWVNNPTYTNWSSLGIKAPTDPSVVQATNWYNLGQARRFALSLTWFGNSNISHDAIEVRYNIKTR